MGCLKQLEIAMSAPGTIEAPKIDHKDLEASDHGWIVTVYNNDYNTYEEVISILILATACGMEEAEMEAWEVDHLGRSVVHFGKETDCRKAGEIIAKIGIRVEVSQE